MVGPITLQIGLVTVNGDLKVGSSNQIIEVKSDAPILKTEDAQVATSLSTQQLTDLPSVDPAEFAEMIRIQIEKVLPFSAEEVTTDFEVIEQDENESVVWAVAIRNEHLAEIAAPLLDRGFIPRQVTVYAAQRASTYAPKGNALLIYPEGEMLVYAMTENGKLSLARVFENGNGEQLQLELPQLRMSAELQGINASFPTRRPSPTRRSS